MLYLKISVRYLKISGLKIAVHSLKIARLKIIARVCVYVRMWVRGCVCGCAPHFAEVSKIVQDATRTGTQRPERPPPEHQSWNVNQNKIYKCREIHRATIEKS